MLTHKWLRNLVLGGLIAIPLTLSGCGLLSKDASTSIDAPPAGVEQSMLNNAQPVQAYNQPETVKAEIKDGLTVFLKDANGYLAPVTLDLKPDKAEDAAVKSLEVMVEDGKYKASLPTGFQAVLPKGTQAKITHDKEQKLAIVEFSTQFRDYDVQDERKIVEAVTWTLTNDPEIQKVQIWVDGQKLNQMPVDGFPMEQPLTRAIGINLEIADGVTYFDSMPVTVYFSAVTPENVQYYVPVTRLIAPTDNLAQASMEQLIKGPQSSDGMLQAVMDSEAKVGEIQQADGMVALDLTDSMFTETDQKIPSEMLQAMILTLTENTSASKVQILLNGKNVTGDDDRNYSEPVDRPAHFNAIKL